jgi:hypothetical protein
LAVQENQGKVQNRKPRHDPMGRQRNRLPDSGLSARTAKRIDSFSLVHDPRFRLAFAFCRARCGRGEGYAVPRKGLRDLTREHPTAEEVKAVFEALSGAVANTPPIVAAVLGAAILDYDLERLLRRRLTRKDDATWELVSGENGLLGTLNAKIVLGYAFGFYDEKLKSNLNTVRRIRNVFAHAKKLMDFDNPTIRETLQKVDLPTKPGRWNKTIAAVRSVAAEGRGQEAFTVLCVELSRQLARYEAARTRRTRRRPRRAPPVNPFLSTMLGQAPETLASGPFALLFAAGSAHLVGEGGLLADAVVSHGQDDDKKDK